MPRSLRGWLWPTLALCAGCALLAPRGPWAKARQAPINLAPLFDNDGVSSAARPADGNFDCPDHPADIPGSTYPAEFLPPGGQAFAAATQPAVRFLFPPLRDREPNNVMCAGQKIDVPPGRYAAVWLLGAGENGEQKGVLRLQYDDGRVDQTIRFPDWCAAAQGEATAAITCPFRYSWHADERKMKREDIPCRLFALPVRADPKRTLESLRLPYNTRLHVFAITLAARSWSPALETLAADAAAYYARPPRRSEQAAAALRRRQRTLRRRLAAARDALPAGSPLLRPAGWMQTRLDYIDHLLAARRPAPRNL